ncbi:hypothetical protein CF319_g3364 [Tilletia indica]|nr:hypothetical protein CF319_g3364 [Tilletia indica]
MYMRDQHHPPPPKRPPPPPPTSLYHKALLPASGHENGGGGGGGGSGRGRGGVSSTQGMRHASGPTRVSAAQALAQVGIQRCDAVPMKEAWSRYGFRGANSNAHIGGDGFGGAGGPIGVHEPPSRGGSVVAISASQVGASYNGTHDLERMGIRVPRYGTPSNASSMGALPQGIAVLPTRELPWSSPPLSTTGSTMSRPGPMQPPDRATTPMTYRPGPSSGHQRVPSLAYSATSRLQYQAQSTFSPQYHQEHQAVPSQQQPLWRQSIPTHYEHTPSTSAAKMHDRMLQQQWANHRGSAPQLHQQYPPSQRNFYYANHHNQPRPAQPLRQAFGPPTMLPAAALPGATVSRQSSSYSHSTTSSASVASILSGPLRLKPGQLVPRCLSSAAGSCSSSDISGFSPPGRMISFSDQRWAPSSQPRKLHSPPRAVMTDPPKTVSRPTLRVANPSSTSSSRQRQRPRMPQKQLSTSSQETLQGPDDQISELISLYRNRSIQQSTRGRQTRASTPDSTSRSISMRSLHNAESASDGDSQSKSGKRSEATRGLGIAFAQGYTGRRNASACVTSAAAAARARVQARRTGKELDATLAELLSPADFVPPERRSSLVRAHNAEVRPTSAVEEDHEIPLSPPPPPPGRRRNAITKQAALHTLPAKESILQGKSERDLRPKKKSNAQKESPVDACSQQSSPRIGSELEAALRMMRTPSVRKAGQEIDFTDERTFTQPGKLGLLSEAKAEQRPILLQPVFTTSKAKMPKKEKEEKKFGKQRIDGRAPLSAAQRNKPVSTPTLPLMSVTSSIVTRKEVRIPRPTQPLAKAGPGQRLTRPTAASEQVGTVAPLRIRPKVAISSTMSRISSKGVSKGTTKSQDSVSTVRPTSPSKSRGKAPSSLLAVKASGATKAASRLPVLSTRSSNTSVATTTTTATRTTRRGGRVPTAPVSQKMKVTDSEASVYSQQSASRSPSLLSDTEGFDASASAMRVVENALARALRGGLVSGHSSSDSLGGSTTVGESGEEYASSSTSTLLRMSSSTSISSDDTIAERPQSKTLHQKLAKATSRSMHVSASKLSENSCLTTTTVRSGLSAASRLPVPVRKRLPPSKLVHQMRLAAAAVAA